MAESNKLNLWDIFCIATGAMISSGLFVLPAIAYRHSGPSIILAYFLAGLLMIPSIFSKSELLTAMPKAGGTYFFIERSFGPFLGIFGGLSHWFSISLKSAFALIGIGTFLEYFYPSVSVGDPHFYFQVKLIAVGFCVFFVIINLFSIKLTARLQNIMVIFLLSACAVYVFFGFSEIKFANFSPFLPQGINPLISVIGLVFISYGGLTKVTSIAEDTKNPSRTIPLGMFLSFLVVQLIYVLCVAVTIGILPKQELMTTFIPLTHAAQKLGGLGFGIMLSLAALVAFVTTANAGILSSSRVPLAMSKDSLLPSQFSFISRKHKTPYVAVLFTGLFMLCLILFLDLKNLVKTASTLMIILFMFVNLSVIIMRESKIINYRPTFKSPFYPFMQIIALIAYGFLIVKMGILALAISISFVFLSLLWFGLCARSIKRQSALMHIVERITAKEFVDTSLEDELKEILHKRDNVIKDRFDHLIETCPVIDLKTAISRDELFKLIAHTFSQRLKVDEGKIGNLLYEREEQSTTVIEKDLALPHIVVEGTKKFEIIIIRSKDGIVFSSGKEPVRVIFALAGSKDERNFHLRALMAIAQIVREGNFHDNWLRMKDQESLRMLVLSSTRKRDI
jgi:amino acid transporter/mannitol/fructose-specific phosphotransferase system IIA component (Ntr-type)